MRFLLLDVFLVLVVVSSASGCDSDGGPVESHRPNAAPTAEPATDVPSEIAKVIERHLVTFRGCYGQALKRSPGLAVVLSIKFTIDEEGGAKDVEILDPYFEHQALEHCFIAALERLRFPPPRAGEPRTFIYRFRFEPPAISDRRHFSGQDSTMLIAGISSSI